MLAGVRPSKQTLQRMWLAGVRPSKRTLQRMWLAGVRPSKQTLQRMWLAGVRPSKQTLHVSQSKTVLPDVKLWFEKGGYLQQQLRREQEMCSPKGPHMEFRQSYMMR